MPDPNSRAKLTFQIKGKREELVTQFNPASMIYEVANTLKEEGRGKSRGQYVTQSSGKLSVDLIFDTTGSGVDVRQITAKIALLATDVRTIEIAKGKASKDAKDNKDKDRKEVLPPVTFEWGLYTFTGVIESFKETLDYFSGGVPLRSLLNLKFSEKTRDLKAQTDEQ